MKVLFIGSESFDYLLLSHKIEPRYSCSFLQAKNNEEVLTVIQNDPLDLIILNWFLPDVDTMDLIDLIRNKENTKKTPLILKLVGMESAEVKQKYRLGGIDDFIPRPYQDKELFELLDKWFLE